MNFLNGMTLLLMYELAGEFSAAVLPLPIPGPVLGMLFLFLTLLVRGRAIPSIEVAGNALLSHLSLLFVPAGVGIMVHFDRIGREWLPIALTLVLTTMLTMAVTAKVMALSAQILTQGVKEHG